MKILLQLRLLFIALWLGAAIFFSAAVAPTLFSVLRSFHLPNANEIAGTVVTRVLGIVNLAGFVISLSLLITAPLVERSRAARFTEMISLGVLGLMTGLSQWAISPRMLALRAAMELPIDQMARDDPRVVAFQSLHGWSVAAMAVAIIAGLIAFLFASRQH